MKKVAFHNLGCKVNSYEMEYMQQEFEKNGYEIVPFAAIADIYVVNTCTVTNIADRKRELATLKVLGYTDWQCMGYTFREIIFITIFATLIGVPISAFIVDFVLRYLEFGSLQDVQWWSYVVTAALEIGLSVGINFLLYPRIIAIDINDSLKSIE